MDNSQKPPQIQHLQPQLGGQGTGVQPVAQVAPSGQSSPSPKAPMAQPVGGVAKEFGPIAHTEAPVEEYITPTEAEPNIPKEVKAVGVEKVPQAERPMLTVEDKRVGMTHAKAAVPVPQAPTGTVILPNAPMTEAEAVMVEKTTKFDDSKHWLAALVLEQFKRAKALLRSKT